MFCEPPMYGRDDAGHSSTIATHHPPATSIASAGDDQSPRRRPQPAPARRPGRRARSRAAPGRPAAILVRNAKPTRHAGERRSTGVRAGLERAHQRRRPPAVEQQHEQRVRVVEPEHQRGDRREREHRAGDQAGRRAVTSASPRRTARPTVATPIERLRHEDRPRVEPEDAGGDLHRPQRERRLVDGDEVGGVGASRRRTPSSSRCRPGRRRSRRSWPSRRRPGPRGRAPR